MEQRHHPISPQALRSWIEEAGRPVGLEYLVRMYLESIGEEQTLVKVYDPKCDFSVGDRVYVPRINSYGRVVQKLVQPDKPWDFIWIRLNNDREQGRADSGVSRYWICNLDRTGMQPQCLVDSHTGNTPDRLTDEALARNRVEQVLLRNGQFVNWGDEWYLKDLLPAVPADLAERVVNHLRAVGRSQRTAELMSAVLGTRENPDDPAYLRLQFAVNVRLSSDAQSDLVCVSHFNGGIWELRERVEKIFATVPERFTLPRVRSQLLREVVYLQPDDYEDDLKNLDQEPPASPRTTTLRKVLSYGEFVTGTLQLPPSQRQFFPPVMQLTFVDLRSGDQFTAYYNRETGCVVGLQEWYYDNLLVPGAIVRIHRTERPGTFGLEVRDGGQKITYRRLVYDAATDEVRQVDETYVTTCEVDPMAFIEQQRLGQLELLRRQAEPGTNLYDLTVRVFEAFGSPLHALKVYHLVDAIRKTTRASIWSILSSYECFEQRPEERGTGLYRLNPAKVGIRRIKLRVKNKVRVPAATEAEAAGARTYWLLVIPKGASPNGVSVANRGCRPGDRVLIAQDDPPTFLGTARVGASGVLTSLVLWPEPLPVREVASDLEMISNPALPLTSYFEPGVRPISAFDYDLASALGSAAPRMTDKKHPTAKPVLSGNSADFAFPPEKKFHLLHNVTILEELDHLLGVVAALTDPFTLDEALAAVLVAQVSDGKFAQFHRGMYKNYTDEVPPDSASLVKKLGGKAKPFVTARRERFRDFLLDPAGRVYDLLQSEYKPGVPLRRYWVEYVRDYIDFATYTGLIYRPCGVSSYRKTRLLYAYLAGKINRYDLLGFFKFRNVAIDYKTLDQYDVEVRPFVAGLQLLKKVERPIPKEWLGCLVTAMKTEADIGWATALAEHWLDTGTGPDDQSLEEGRRGFRFLHALLDGLIRLEKGLVSISKEGEVFLQGVPGRAVFCGGTIHGLPLDANLAFVLSVLADKVRNGEREIGISSFTAIDMHVDDIWALITAIQSWPDSPIESIHGTQIRLASLHWQYQVNPYTDLVLPLEIARFEELHSRWNSQ